MKLKTQKELQDVIGTITLRKDFLTQCTNQWEKNNLRNLSISSLKTSMCQNTKNEIIVWEEIIGHI